MANKLYSFYVSDGFFWIRFLQFGIVIRDTKKNPPLFSEREGFVKVIRIGKWSIKSIRQ